MRNKDDDEVSVGTVSTVVNPLEDRVLRKNCSFLYRYALSLIDLHSPILDADVPLPSAAFTPEADREGSYLFRPPGVTRRAAAGTFYQTGGRRVDPKVTYNHLGQVEISLSTSNTGNSNHKDSTTAAASIGSEEARQKAAREALQRENQKKLEQALKSEIRPYVPSSTDGKKDSSANPTQSQEEKKDKMTLKEIKLPEVSSTEEEKTAANISSSSLSTQPQGQQPPSAATSADITDPTAKKQNKMADGTAGVDTSNLGKEKMEQLLQERETALKAVLNALPMLKIVSLSLIVAQCYKVSLPWKATSSAVEIADQRTHRPGDSSAGESSEETASLNDVSLSTIATVSRNGAPAKTLHKRRAKCGTLLSLLGMLPHNATVKNGCIEEFRRIPLKLGVNCDDAGSVRAGLWGKCEPFYLRGCCYRLLEYFDRKQPSSFHLQSIDNTQDGGPLGRRATSLGRSGSNGQPTTPGDSTSNLGDFRSPRRGPMSPGASSSNLSVGLQSAGANRASSPAAGGRGGYDVDDNRSREANNNIITLSYEQVLLDLARKRRQYENYVNQYWVDGYYPPVSPNMPLSQSMGRDDYDVADRSLSPSASDSFMPFSPSGARSVIPLRRPVPSGSEGQILNQLGLDLPRHKTTLYHCPTACASLARVIFLFSQRHPAMGYVQGMDDVFHMFYLIFFADAFRTVQAQLHDELESTIDSYSNVLRECRVTKAKHSCEHCGDGEDPRKVGNVERDVNVNVVFVEKMILLEADGSLMTEEYLNSTATMDVNRLEQFIQLYFLQQETPRFTEHWNFDDFKLNDVTTTNLLLQVEADTFFSASRLLSQLQDNYRTGQPGLRAAGQVMDTLLEKESPEISQRCNDAGLHMVDVCFQWLHCLLLRELPLPLSLMLWDTYRAVDVEEVFVLHQCVCTAIVLSMKKHILAAAPELLMMLFKAPYETLFPEGFPSLSDCGYVLRDAANTDEPSAAHAKDSNDHSSKAAKLRAKRESRKKQFMWMEMIIADGYRIWRQNF